MFTATTLDFISGAQTTDLLRVAVIVPILLYASYTDIQSRRVDDKVWIPPIIAAVGLLAYDAHVGEPIIVVTAALLSVMLIGGIAFILYKSRVFYGADYKAFFVIALLFPWQPMLGVLPWYDLSWITYAGEILAADGATDALLELSLYIAVVLFGFTVFVNTALCAVVYFIWNAIHNIREDTFSLTHPLRSTCAREVAVSDLSDMHGQIIEEPEKENKILKGLEFIQNGLRGLSTDFFKEYTEWYSSNKTVSQTVNIEDIDEVDLEGFLNDMDDWASTDPEEDKKTIQRILDRERVWMTPGVPFIVPITLGVLTSIVFGNLMYILIMFVL